MALNSTILKVTLNITDMDRNYYASHNLTVAKHPSETDTRLMVRMLAFALNANEQLTFTKGLSTDDEPDIWQKKLTDDIELWIDLGQPDEKRIKKALGRADKVVLYNYGGGSDKWWQQHKLRHPKLSIWNIPLASTDALLKFAQAKSMTLNVTIQDGELWLSDDESNELIEIQPRLIN